MDLLQLLKDCVRRSQYKLNDKYVIRDGKQHPLAIICPGGGYSLVCSFVEGVPYARWLNQKGISAVIVYYHVRKAAKYPAPQEDLARAVREIAERADTYHVSMEHYSIWGSSAGGHLAASFGTEHMGYARYHLPKPECLVLAYPVISMRKELTHSGSRKNLLGEDAQLQKEIFASIDEHITPDYPRTFLWCGDADQVVQPENSKRMDKALTKANVPHEFVIYSGAGHGIGLAKGTAAENWIEKAVQFWLGKQVQ